MNEQEREHFEGLIVKAIQSGKKETSDLVTDIMARIENKLENTIAASIEKNVNGKIRKLDEKIDVYINEDNKYKERITKETDDWRKGADDKLKIVSDIQAFGNVGSKILGFIIMLGAASGAWFSVVKLVDWIKGK